LNDRPIQKTLLCTGFFSVGNKTNEEESSGAHLRTSQESGNATFAATHSLYLSTPVCQVLSRGPQCFLQPFLQPPFLFSQALLCTRKRGCALIHSQRMNAAAE
jgi:hypothetical protein